MDNKIDLHILNNNQWNKKAKLQFFSKLEVELYWLLFCGPILISSLCNSGV